MSSAAIGQTSVAAEPCPQPPPQQPTQSLPNGQDMDLMVTEEVVTVDDIPYEGIEDMKTCAVVDSGRQPSTAVKKSKILVTLSDDLSYTLAIDGDSLSAVMDSISSDKDMKSEWNSWQRFCQNPNQFFVYIYDEDFKEYVRYRQDVPIGHLSRLKIKNKIYVNQTGLKSCYQSLIGSQSPVIDNGFDTEPTDALVNDCQPPNPPSIAAPALVSSPSAPTLATHHMKTHNTAINEIISQNAIINASQYHHNYHMSSPSAPALFQPLETVKSCPPAVLTSAVAATTLSADPMAIRYHQNTSKLTKAAKKLFDSDINQRNNSSETDSLSGDLLADAPTGPTFDWTQEQTIAFLNHCKHFSKELAPKRNALEVKPQVWEQLAKDLNSRDFGQTFDALMCRNHFSRLRLTYTNVLCYPGLRDETRWPYFELMKEIIGEKPEEIQSKVKTRAQSLSHKTKNGKPAVADRGQTAAAAANHNRGTGGKPNSGGVMKNSANQEVSELYVALLNLVKKYMKYFETEKKNHIWTRIETELKSAGYKWSATALRGLFYRLRYTYIRILRNFGDSETASNSWPYFRYFQNLDLKAFPCRRDFDLKEKNKGFKSVANRRPVVGRQQQKRQQLRKGSKRRAATRRPTVQQKPKAVLNKPEGQAAIGHEYSDGQTSGSDVEGVENKRKKTESV